MPKKPPMLKFSWFYLALCLLPGLPALAEDPDPNTTGLAAAQQAPYLELTVDSAILMALQHNRALKLERFLLQINETEVQQQLGQFDPNLTGRAEQNSEIAQRQFGAEPNFFDIISGGQDYRLGLQQTFATGSQVALELGTSYSARTFGNNTVNQQISRLGLSFTQALLQGRDPAVNLAQVRQAELATVLAGYNLRGFAEALVADTEIAFWDYILARQQVGLTEASMALARQQLDETRQRIEVGRLAELEALTLAAELALREQELVSAQGQFEKQRLALLRLLSPGGQNWAAYQLALAQPLGIPVVRLDSLEEHIQVALKQRPELRQTQIQIQRQELEIVRTRDGLMPRLDLFLTLGKTGYSDNVLGSMANLFTDNGFDFIGGVQLNYPLGLRSAEAELQKARLTQAQQQEALHNLEQVVELDVRQAYLDVRIAREQIQVSKTSRGLQSARLHAETERYEVGRSTAFQVAQAQRDLLASQLAEVQALMDYMKSLTRFYRMEGTLLQRRGISTLMAEAPAPDSD